MGDGDCEGCADAGATNVRCVTSRSFVLPSRGTLLVSTDLHGNLEDFLALEAKAEAAWQAGVELHWALLGDLVHGPDERGRRQMPDLYDYDDESPALIDRLFELKQRRPEHVHVVLGNHDVGHLGFPHTSKFHPDEVEALEVRLSTVQHERMQSLFSNGLLVLVAPCGLLLSHGVPGDALTSLALLDGVLPPTKDQGSRFRAVNELLWSYGQSAPIAASMLERISDEVGHRLRVVVHGHDRDHSGWYIEGDNQVQPVLFGAPRANKRYLEVDLSRPVESCRHLESDMLRHLHPLQGPRS